MSAGYVHKKASIILAAAFAAASILTLDMWSLKYSIGALIGIIITPDLDVDAGFIGDKTIRQLIAGKFNKKKLFRSMTRKAISEIILWLWIKFWYWYRRSLKHGSPLSHLPVVSTLGRIGYIYFIIIVIPHVIFKYLLFLDWDIILVLNWYWNNIMSEYQIIIGLMASDLIHWTLDVMTTEHKEKTKVTYKDETDGQRLRVD